jgi:hypothetical protein
MSMCSNCSIFNSLWGAKKGVVCKCDAYDIKESNRRLVVPRPGTSGKIRDLQVLVQTPKPPDSGSNQS